MSSVCRLVFDVRLFDSSRRPRALLFGFTSLVIFKRRIFFDLPCLEAVSTYYSCGPYVDSATDTIDRRPTTSYNYNLALPHRYVSGDKQSSLSMILFSSHILSNNLFIVQQINLIYYWIHRVYSNECEPAGKSSSHHNQ